MKSGERARMVAAARDLLMTDGYEACTVEAAARAAGLDRKAADAAVSGREDLVAAALDAHWAELKPFIKTALDPGLPALERLRRFFTGAADFQALHWEKLGCVAGCMLLRVGSAASRSDVDVRRKVAEIFGELTGMLKGPLTDAMSEGRIRKGDPEVMARTLVQYTEGVLGLAQIDNDLPALKAAMARGLEFLGAEPPLLRPV